MKVERIPLYHSSPLSYNTEASPVRLVVGLDKDDDDETMPTITQGGTVERRHPRTLLWSLSFVLYTGVMILVGASLQQIHSSTIPSSASLAASTLEPQDATTPLLLGATPPNSPQTPLYSRVPSDDFGPLLEFSVVHSDRSLNLMSIPFQTVMRDLSQLLKGTYHAYKVAIIPGSGTFGMEAVARQFAARRHVMVLRHGYFSYRWTQIFDMGGAAWQICKSHSVLAAQPVSNHQNTQPHPQYAPPPVDEVVERIRLERPAVLFAPHVETSTGMMLPKDYIQTIATAMHKVGGLLVLDCIASGTVWIDMEELGVDVLISAPQKDWTSPPCAALVMLSRRAFRKMTEDPQEEESSFSLSLRKWWTVMDAYEQGGYAYHTTPPTDALRVFQQVSVEILTYGLRPLQEAFWELGTAARQLFDARGLISVAAPGYQAPGVLVYYSPSQVDDMVTRFQEEGLQIAKGVPWMIGEPAGIETFRIGLFGIDKLIHQRHHSTLHTLETALDRVLEGLRHEEIHNNA